LNHLLLFCKLRCQSLRELVIPNTFPNSNPFRTCHPLCLS
jgi:hypothetical protein